MSSNLRIKDLNISYTVEDSRIEVLKGVDLELKQQRFYGIIGKTGSGKSTLIKAIANILPNNAKVESGTIEYKCEKKDYDKCKPILGIVLQDPYASLNPVMLINWQFIVTYGIRKAFFNYKEFKLKVREALELVDLDSYVLSRYPEQLSGGMNQRINLALNLLNNPELLILDEPTSALDWHLRNDLMELIARLCECAGVTVLMISHDIKLIRKYADEIFYLDEGIIKKDTNKFLTTCLEEHDKSEYENDEILRCENITKHFNGKLVLNKLNLKLHRKECLGIVGPSGCGKTTICKILNGIYDYDNGELKIKEGIKIEMLFQNTASSLNPMMRVMEILNESKVISKQKPFTKRELEEWLHYFKLPSKILQQKSRQLSGGQKQMVAILRAVLNTPDIIVLDEPTSAMDVSLQKDLLVFLKRIQQELNLTYILVSHDKEVVNYMCHTVIELQKIV